MAARLNVAFIGNTHLTKSTEHGKALYRFIGSIATVAAARAAFAIVEDRDDPARRLLLHAKNNLAPEPAGLAFRPSGACAREGQHHGDLRWILELWPDGSFVSGKHKKTFRQKRPDPDRPGAWLWNVEGVPAPIYRLPEVTEAIAAERTVLVVEGEAKADLLWSWNMPATACAGGAKKWKPEHAQYLRGADVIILGHHDRAGAEHIDVVGASLQDIAASGRVLELPGLPPKGDIIDWANLTEGDLDQPVGRLA